MKLNKIKTGIFGKLFVLHLLATAVLFFTIVLAYYYIEKKNFNSSLIEKSILIHDVLEISCIDPVVGTIAYDRVDSIIEALYRKNREIIYIEIYDPTAHIIAFVGNPPDTHLDFTLVTELFKQNPGSASQIECDKDFNEVLSYLNVQGRHLGIIRIGFTKKNLEAQLISNVLYFLGLFIIAIAATSLIFYIFTLKRIIQPIVNVSNIMQNYGKDELDTLYKNIKKYNQSILKDEIGIMSSAFEQMILSIIQQTEKKENAQKSLEASNKRFLTVLESIDATIYVADMQTYEILFMNRNMIKSFGKDMTGEICWKAFRNESTPCSFCSNERLLDETMKPSGVYTWEGKNPITGKWYANYDRAIEWTDGKIVKLQISSDITHLKQMEQKLIQSQKMESIGTLAGGIAHDFNNILFPIMGYTEMLMADIPEESPYQTRLKKIFASAMRAKDLVRQILTFSRQESNKLSRVKIQPVIKEGIKLIQSLIPANIEIKHNISKECGRVNADPTQIHQIILNLVTNAQHAMEDRGGELNINLKEVRLETNNLVNLEIEPGVYACLSISDTGTGMEPELTKKIFDPFFTTKEIGKGTGMGLSVIHGIVTGMDGDIQVFTEPGLGTKFEIYLPIASEKTN